MSRPTRHRGFSLIELLIYIALLVVISTASVSYLLSLDEVLTQYRIEAALYRSGSNALEQIQVALRQADSLDVGNSTFNDSGAGRLTIDADGLPTQFVKTGSDLEVIIDGTSLGSIVTNEVSVDSFTIYRYSTAIGDMIRVELSLTATAGGVSKSVTLYTGSVIRGDVS